MVKRTSVLSQSKKVDLTPTSTPQKPEIPKKRRSKSLPPPLSNLDGTPTFTGRIFGMSKASPVGKAKTRTPKKPSIKSCTSRALHLANRGSSVLGARVARAERVAGDLCMKRESLAQMTDIEWRVHMEKRWATMVALVTIVDERKTQAIAKQTSLDLQKDKIFRSSLLQREMDRTFLQWVLNIRDPRSDWIPPFRAGSVWKSYIQSEIRSGGFTLAPRIKHDLDKCWIVARDRRDAVDQKKMKFVNASSKSYTAALTSIKDECILDFSKKAADPEQCYQVFVGKIVLGTGLRDTISSWLQTYNLPLPERGIIALGGILEHVLLKGNVSMRNDFASIWSRAMALRKQNQTQDDLATQPLYNMLDWSM